MKETEKLDFVLKDLYKYRHSEQYHSLRDAVNDVRIPVSLASNLTQKAKKLEMAGLIDLRDLKCKIMARITHKGIRFCETTSYAYKGYPIITE